MPADNATALYTAEQVRRIDRNAIERFGIASPTLMQRAADAAFRRLQRRWPLARRLLLLCGPGNNGGDAWLLGATALYSGWHVDAIAFAEPRGDAFAACQRYVDAGGSLVDVADATSLPAADIIVDGLLGIGLDRDVDASMAAWIDQANASGLPILALDVPSGLCADSGTRRGKAIRANLTVSFVAWKRGLFTAAALDHCGELKLETLDIPSAAYAGIAPDARLLDDRLGCLLVPRDRDSNKGSFGHVVAIGGDEAMGGAIRLAGEAALRCGAGKVTVATRSQHVGSINAARPELIVRAVDGPQDMKALLDGIDVIAIGPGLGQRAWGHALWDVAIHAGIACVIDADGLNLLARNTLRLAGEEVIVGPALPTPRQDLHVLTPHPGEAARLLGCDVATVQSDRYAAARRLAAQYRAVVVLKGAGSVITDPDGHVAVCPWGNPGMASAGVGDVLTGVIAALLAQGLSAWDAARLGVALHARAGDIAAGNAPRGLLASDLFAPLRQLVNTAPQ